MKTIAAVAVLLFLSAWTYGQNQPGHYDLTAVSEQIKGSQYVVSITSWERQKLEITIDKPVGTPAEIILKSDDRLILYRDQSYRLDGAYRRWLNLRELEPGSYWLIIDIGRDRIQRKIQLEAIATEFRRLSMQ